MGSNAMDPLMRDLKTRYEFLGLQALLIPHVQYVSSQRMMMFCSNIAQALITFGVEPPLCCTGWEGVFGKYELNDSTREQDIIILAVIPKFMYTFNGEITSNPVFTVIYIGQDDHKIGYVDVCSYTKLSDGFGYMNKMMNQELLMKNQFVPKEVKFQTSPNHFDNMYGYGTNVNMAFLSDWATTEDAFVISKEYAESQRHWAIGTVKRTFNEDEIPLNINGKSFPDIGETVRESDGVAMAFRKRNETTFISDCTPKSLSEIEWAHDDPVVLEPGSVILDVNVYVNFNVYRTLTEKPGPYAQFIKYADQHMAYYRAVLDIYDQVREDGYELSPEFNTLVTRCIGLLGNAGGRTRSRLTLVDKKEPIRFMSVELTYAYVREINRGFKFSGRDGSKGVVSDIRPRAMMPRHVETGVYADFLETCPSVINRMNVSQAYCQFYNCGSDQVLRDTKDLPPLEAYERIMYWIERVRPELRAKYESCIEDDVDKIAFVNDCRKQGIYLIFGFQKNITYQDIIDLANEFNIKRYPFHYIVQNPDGTTEEVVTKTESLIGKKYIMVVGKLPGDALHAIQTGFTNQFGLPVKPTSKYIKLQSPIGQTPQRRGEDEVCIANMVMNSNVIARQLAINGNSPEGVDALNLKLLTDPHPSRIQHAEITTQEAIDTNRCIQVFRQLSGIVGYDMRPKKRINGGKQG